EMEQAGDAARLERGLLAEVDPQCVRGAARQVIERQSALATVDHAGHLHKTGIGGADGDQPQHYKQHLFKGREHENVLKSNPRLLMRMSVTRTGKLNHREGLSTEHTEHIEGTEQKREEIEPQRHRG